MLYQRGLHSLCYDLDAFIANDMEITELFGIYDDVAEELYRLMNHSFRRFVHKLDKGIYVLSKQPLFQPMRK